MVDDRNVSFGFQEQTEVFPLMTDECDNEHDNLVSMSYEDDQQCIQITEDQGICGVLKRYDFDDYFNDFLIEFGNLLYHEFGK